MTRGNARAGAFPSAVRSVLPALALLACLLLGATVPPASAADTLPELIEAYEATVPRAAERSEDAYQAQADALERIAALKSASARQALTRLLVKYGAGEYRQAALILGALVRHGVPADVRFAIQWIEDRRDPLMMDRLHTVLAEVQAPATLRFLREDAIRGSTPTVKVQILRAFALRKDATVRPTLFAMTRASDRNVRLEAVESLGVLGDRKARPLIQAFLRDPDVDLRAIAARALGRIGDPGAVPALERALGDANPRVVESAAVALGRLDDPRAMPALIAGLARVQGRNLRLADAFTQALQGISGKAIHDDAELWRAWWEANKDRQPFTKGREKPGTKTVPGPTYYDVPVRSSRVIFVLDVSRSMGWNQRLETAKEELLQVLDKLPRTTWFNLVVFSQRAWPWKSGLQKADRRNVNNAKRWIRAQKPLLGTNTYGALKTCFADPQMDTIFLLSDGHPSEGRITDPQLILGAVREWNRLRNVRIHGIALLKGPAPAAYQSLEDQERSLWFMEHLCEQNGGRFREIK